jgi:Rha family phage regulatory protein
MNQIGNTLTSLEVADMVGKEHSKVIRDIRNIISHLTEAKNGLSAITNYFTEDTYKDSTGRELPCYRLTKKGCELFSTRMTGAKGTQFAVAYIERFNEMEDHIKQQQIQLPTDPMEILKLTFQAQENTVKEVEKVKDRVTDLEENAPLSPGDYSYISRRINQRVNEIVRGYDRVTSEQRSSLYLDINHGIKAVTGVMTRTQLRAKHYGITLEYINNWEPSTATRMKLKQTSFDFPGRW